MNIRKTTRSIVATALRSDGVEQGDIEAALARAECKSLTPDKTTPLLLTQAQTARLLNCSRFTIRRMVEDGQLQPVDLRGLRRYRLADIQRITGISMN